jgi:hypothetical protein
MATVRAKCSGLIRQVIQTMFDKSLLTGDVSKNLLEIGILCLLKCPKNVNWPATTGLVIAGFGSTELFPAMQCFALHGIFDGQLHHQELKSDKLGFAKTAAIVPFAQDDMAYTFMEGVDQDYQRTISQDVKQMLEQCPTVVLGACKFLDAATKQKIGAEFSAARDQIAKSYLDGLKKYRREKFVDPILGLVAMLPKSELPVLAESMVSLTALRRKISMDTETVGGPIDVALISKGDGLIWIKRKHYFDPALNHQFFYNRKMEALQ